ncbi:MAG: HEAT repeat domain-containing protein [Gammaproteobacteria bacterium]|nr:MAG: HEAT repeat domain-containing protein [Gammaproteobacteria bacterium]
MTDTDDSDWDVLAANKLTDAMHNNNPEFIGFAEGWLKTSSDEVLRSICLDYLESLNRLTEETLILALKDSHDLVRTKAINLVASVESERIVHQLKLMLPDEEDEFVAAWAYIELSIRDRVPSGIEKVFRKKWLSSELVRAGIAFRNALFQRKENEIRGFLNFIKSQDYLVRGLVIDLSVFFTSSSFSYLVIHALNEVGHSDPLLVLQENAKKALENFSSI